MSGETKWTPGEWRVFTTTDGFTSVYPADAYCPTADKVGFALQGPRKVIAGDVRDNDAHLIAAAPELYAALEEARAWMWRLDNATPMDCGAQCETLHLANKMVDAALAKARGEAR